MFSPPCPLPPQPQVPRPLFPFPQPRRSVGALAGQFLPSSAASTPLRACGECARPLRVCARGDRVCARGRLGSVCERVADKGSGLRGAEGGAGRVRGAWGPRMRFAAGPGYRPEDASPCSMALGAWGGAQATGAVEGAACPVGASLGTSLGEGVGIDSTARFWSQICPSCACCVTLGQSQLVFGSVSHL